MSRAFTKETEQEWLGDVAPEISALEQYLSREYGEKVRLVKTVDDPRTGRATHEMSNGNRYALDMDQRWIAV